MRIDIKAMKSQHSQSHIYIFSIDLYFDEATAQHVVRDDILNTHQSSTLIVLLVVELPVSKKYL